MESNVPVIRQPDARGGAAVLSEVVNQLQRQDRREQLVALLGSEAAVERFQTVALHYLAGNLSLLERCTPESILIAIREAATLDLEPTGILGEAWIVRHGNKAVLRVGWRGYLKMLRRSHELKSVDCQIVYENDQFSVELGTDPFIKHVPTLDTDRGEYKGAYAWARLGGGDLIIEWMPTADIEAVRAVSQAKNDGPWTTWWAEMARKSAIRRLVKRLPMSASTEAVVRKDEEADELEFKPHVAERRSRTLEALAEASGAPLEPDDAQVVEEALSAADEAELDEALEGHGGA